ncbi:MAG: response regulator [Proteobacteria bacterium]|nr:response regulator [Pseudomonadota bacterium]
MKSDENQTSTLSKKSAQDTKDHKPADSEKKKFEEQLRRAQRMESIGRLAGGVAHNLNNILSPIIGYTDMALGTLDHGNPLYSHIEEIRTATERATDLIRQLLAFGRKQSFKLRVLNLSEVVTDLESILRQSIREDIELKLALDQSLYSVKADRAQVQQIIVNLALNACEAMLDGGEITIKTANVVVDKEHSAIYQDVHPGPHVLLAVSDTGKGMDQDTLNFVFEPFFTTKEVGQGTGLGLATVYGIVKQHGGHIRVDSEPDQGATFNVYLPRYDEQSVPLATPTIEPSPAFGNETILVVEDEESLLKFTSLVLKKMGYNVLEASNGKEAIEIAMNQTDPIDLLLTDVIMPGMNGKEIYKKLSVTHPLMKILYMSGYPDNVIARHGIIDKNENLLQKPTTVDRLAEKVRQTLDE